MIMAEVDWGPILEKAIAKDTIQAILGISLAILIVSLIAWWHMRKLRLKEKMIERGFSAFEIEEVMTAGQSQKKWRRR